MVSVRPANSVPTTNQTSLLLSLPPELRNYIYRLAILSNKAITIYLDPKLELCAIKEPALLHTCRQIRGEAFLIFYAENTFTPETGTSMEILRHMAFGLPDTRLLSIKRLQDFTAEQVEWRELDQGDGFGGMRRSEDWVRRYKESFIMLWFLLADGGFVGDWHGSLFILRCREMVLFPIRNKEMDTLWVTLEDLREFELTRDAGDRWYWVRVEEAGSSSG